MITIALAPFKIDASSTSENPLDQLDLHIVATAVKKFGFCVSYLTQRGMNVIRVGEFCDMVNVKDEVGSFYPKHQMSLFPIFPSGEDEPVEVKLKKYAKDILASHAYFKKAKTILFVFDAASGYDLTTVVSQLESILNQMPEAAGISYYYTIYS